MTKLRHLWRRLQALWRSERIHSDIAEELTFHIDQRTADNVRAGMSPDEARREAERRFGWMSRIQENAYEVRGGGWMESVLRDVVYGLRMLRKSPGFTIVAILTLALGIGANTAIFSLVDSILLRPLPFHDPDQLVVIWEDQSRIGFSRGNPAPGNYSDWKTQNRVFEDIAASSGLSFNLGGEDNPEKVGAQAVTANLFPLLGIQPLLGRTFIQADDRPDANKVVLLSHSLWKRRFGGESQLIGKEILLNDQKFTVIGVMPVGFQFLGSEVDLWVPAQFTQENLMDRGSHYLTVVGRLKTDVTLQQAQADINTVTQRIAQDFPRNASNLCALVLPLREQLVGGIRLSLLVLSAAAGFVLLLTCANVAGLLLSRASARRREIAVRTALGASRARIIRQLLTESLLLAGLGGGAGLIIAYCSFGFLGHLIPRTMATSTSLRINLAVLGYSLVLSLATGAVFGVAPSAQTTKMDLNNSLRQSGGWSGTDKGQSRLRRALVVVEVALAFVVLVGAGLMIHTLMKLRGQDPGFRSDHVLVLSTTLPRQKYGDISKRCSFYEQVLQRVRTLPGVISAAYTTAVPLTWKGGTNSFSIEGRAYGRGQDANHRQISPDYFRTLSIPLKQGRSFDEHDNTGSVPVAIINETMAHRFWPNENPLGKRFKLGPPDSSNPWITIVGIAGDVKQMGLDAPVKSEMYFPYSQIFYNVSYAPSALVIRTVDDPMSLVGTIRHEVWAVDREQPVSNVKTMEEILEGETAQRSLGTSLLTVFAGLALLLATLGIYGILSHAVKQRTPEIGVRMAMGARPTDVLQVVIKDGMRLTLLGLAIGLAASLVLTQMMVTMLFGVTTTDPLTLGSVVTILIVVALTACYLPARRASKLNPMVALRCE